MGCNTENLFGSNGPKTLVLWPNQIRSRASVSGPLGEINNSHNARVRSIHIRPRPQRRRRVLNVEPDMVLGLPGSLLRDDQREIRREDQMEEQGEDQREDQRNNQRDDPEEETTLVPDLSFLVDSGFLTTEDLALEPEDAESTILLPAPSIQRAAQEEREGMSPREMIRQRVRRVRRARRRAALSRRASLLFGSMAIEQNGAEPASDTEDGD